LTDSGYFALKLFNSQCLCVDGFSAKHDKFFDSHIAHVCLGKNSTIDPYTVFITNTQVKNFKGKVVIGLREAATAEIDKYTSANPPPVPAPNTATLGTYDIFTYSSSCQYFDEKKNQWSAAGCSVSFCVVPSLSYLLFVFFKTLL
jgi:hypothetical protein